MEDALPANLNGYVQQILQTYDFAPKSYHTEFRLLIKWGLGCIPICSQISVTVFCGSGYGCLYHEYVSFGCFT